MHVRESGARPSFANAECLCITGIAKGQDSKLDTSQCVGSKCFAPYPAAISSITEERQQTGRLRDSELRRE